MKPRVMSECRGTVSEGELERQTLSFNQLVETLKVSQYGQGAGRIDVVDLQRAATFLGVKLSER